MWPQDPRLAAGPAAVARAQCQASQEEGAHPVATLWVVATLVDVVAAVVVHAGVEAAVAVVVKACLRVLVAGVVGLAPPQHAEASSQTDGRSLHPQAWPKEWSDQVIGECREGSHW